jgi:hypothetical protein
VVRMRGLLGTPRERRLDTTDAMIGSCRGSRLNLPVRPPRLNVPRLPETETPCLKHPTG